MQKLTLIGNLGKDAQVVESMNGKKCLSFSVAANGYRNGEQKTCWYNVVWFNYAPNMVQYLTKGKSVVVVGELDADIRVDNSGVSRIDRSVVADSVTFLSVNSGTENNGNTTSTTQPKQETKKTYNQTNVVPSNDDEISAMTSRQTSAPAQEVFDDLPF